MFCSIAILASFLPFCAEAVPLAPGYVEGEYVLVAPIETARIERLDVARGDPVALGQDLVVLERRDAELLAAQAEAALARARSELSDLTQGARQAELDVVRAGVQSAAADLAEAEREHTRLADLFARNVASQSQLDVAQANLEVARARLRQAEANLAVLMLPARPDRIAAAEAVIAEATAALESARWRLEQRALSAPATGIVADIYRYPGDLAGPQAPVLSILPDDGIKLRFYVPEPHYARMAVGVSVSFSCDGCPEGLRATVSYLATSPEFTPPVIYSLDARQRLVYLAEARIDATAGMTPGQIVDVQLPGAQE